VPHKEVRGGEGPDDGFYGYAVFYVRVVGDVFIVIIFEKFVLEDRPECHHSQHD
jgi:hypothetical protein